MQFSIRKQSKPRHFLSSGLFLSISSWPRTIATKTYVITGLVICYVVSQGTLFGQTPAEEPSRSFPYNAVAGDAGAFIRSAPGAGFYGTTKLQPGDEVEVWRHDPEGWVAIRPPRDSFSLVRAEHTRFVTDQIVEIIDTDCKSWVGTRLGEVEAPMWQVKLKPGEKLAVLGEIEIDGEVVWIQIAPPSGEFRWVHQNELKEDTKSHHLHVDNHQRGQFDVVGSGAIESELRSPQDILHANSIEKGGDDVRDRQISGGNPIENTGSQIATSSTRYESTNSWPVDQARYLQSVDDTTQNNSTKASSNHASNGGWKPAKRKMSKLLDKRETFSQYDGTRVAMNQSESFETNWDGIQTSGINTADIGDFDASLNDSTIYSVVSLELLLSKQVINDPSQWNLQPLLSAASRATQANINQQERQAYQNLLDKIRRFQVVKAKHQAANRASTYGGIGNSLGNAYASVSTESELAGQYDATGFLGELIRDGGLSAPAYVLQDATGKITHHVTAAPGVNMRRYLKQEVGLIGQRGFNAQLKLDHVNVARVVVLDRHRTVQHRRQIR